MVLEVFIMNGWMRWVIICRLVVKWFIIVFSLLWLVLFFVSIYGVVLLIYLLVCEIRFYIVLRVCGKFIVFICLW